MPQALRRIGRDLRPALRFARGYRRFVRTPVTPGSASTRVRDRLAGRDGRFLDLVRERVYGHPSSPYLPLLRAAGCEFADLRAMVLARGLDAALHALASAGVRISIDEFKGRVPIRRGALALAVAERDFDNPSFAPAFEAASGGTRSAGTRVGVDLGFVAALAEGTALTFDAHDLWKCTQCVWLPITGTAPVAINIYAKLGRPVARWWTQVSPDEFSPRRRLWERFMRAWAPLAGGRVPAPEHATLSDAAAVAKWLAAASGRGSTPCLTTYASTAVRVARAAAHAGLDLSGAVFITIGEPFTPAKRRVIESVGARVVVRYAITEAGILGYGCAAATECDDVHAMSHDVALIPYPRSIGHDGLEVSGLLVTSLLPSSPKILLNVETGDYAETAERECGCGLGRAGLRTHLSAIRSFEKLTGEGVTLVGTRLLRVLEETLPARFGGQPGDYQLLEVEDAGGTTRLEVRADPALGPLDESLVREVFLTALEDDVRAGFAAGMWRQAETIRLSRAAPLPTRAGKVLPFHLVTLQRRPVDAPPPNGDPAAAPRQRPEKPESSAS